MALDATAPHTLVMASVAAHVARDTVIRLGQVGAGRSPSSEIVEQRRAGQHQHGQCRGDARHLIGVFTGAVQGAGVVAQFMDQQVDVPGAGGWLFAEPLGAQDACIERHLDGVVTGRPTACRITGGGIIRPVPGRDGFVQGELAHHFRELPEPVHRRRDLLRRQRQGGHVMLRPQLVGALDRVGFL